MSTKNDFIADKSHGHFFPPEIFYVKFTVRDDIYFIYHRPHFPHVTYRICAPGRTVRFFIIPIFPIRPVTAPPTATRFAAYPMSMSPGIGPFETPWSIGMMTVFFVLRFMIRSRRISFPLMVTTSSPLPSQQFSFDWKRVTD